MITARDLESIVDSIDCLPVSEKTEALYERKMIYKIAAAVVGAIEDFTAEVKKLREAVENGGRKEA
ncbi:MAG: hypothetical protein ACRD1Z_21035 [Vicinamibacteria bacterium]